MAHSNHFYSKSKFAIKRFFSFLLIYQASVSSIYAEPLAMFDPNYSHGETYSVSLQSFVANDPLSLEELFNDWGGAFHPHEGNNIALESSRFDLGLVLKNDYYIGYTYRHDVFIETSHDFVVLNYLTKNKRDLPLGEVFDLSLNIDGFDAQGIVFGKNFTFTPHEEASLSLSLSASFLYAKHMQKGTLSGTGMVVSAKDYDFYATSDYYYTHNYLYNLDVDSPHGLGFTTHLTLSYQYNDFSMMFIANDLFGKIFWDALPYSYVSMSSDNKYYDDDGYIHYDPTIHGRESQEKFTQTLPAKLHLEASYLMEEKYAVSVGAQYMLDTLFPFTTFTYLQNDNERYFVSYESRFGSATIGTNYHHVSVALSADKVSAPSTLGIQISTYLHF